MNRLAILNAARMERKDALQLLEMDKQGRLAWLRETVSGLDTDDDDALDDALCTYLRAGAVKTQKTELSSPAMQCKKCGVSVGTTWNIKLNSFVGVPHECTTPWRYASNLQHVGNAPEPSLEDAVAALLLTAWSFTDYSPHRPNKTRKVIRVLNARTHALRDLVRLARQIAPADSPELQAAIAALALE